MQAARSGTPACALPNKAALGRASRKVRSDPPHMPPIRRIHGLAVDYLPTALRIFAHSLKKYPEKKIPWGHAQRLAQAPPGNRFPKRGRASAAGRTSDLPTALSHCAVLTLTQTIPLLPCSPLSSCGGETPPPPTVHPARPDGSYPAGSRFFADSLKHSD